MELLEHKLPVHYTAKKLPALNVSKFKERLVCKLIASLPVNYVQDQHFLFKVGKYPKVVADYPLYYSISASAVLFGNLK